MKAKSLSVFTNGLVKENPTLRLVLGTCPTLAVTTTLKGGIGMGIAATIVLVCSNFVISLLRKVIPDKVRIPAYITIIAGFVSAVQMLVNAYAPSVANELGIYLPLIVVNCIIFARAEMFASKNPPIASVLDGLGMGIGFTAALMLMGSIRELLGSGTLLGMPITSGAVPPMLIFILPPGGFFVFGMLIAASNALFRKKGEKPAVSAGCAGCPSKDICERKCDENER